MKTLLYYFLDAVALSLVLALGMWFISLGYYLSFSGEYINNHGVM